MKSVISYLILFLEYLTGLGYADVTIKAYRRSINSFDDYLNRVNKNDVREVRKEDVIAFIKSYEGRKTRFNRSFNAQSLYRTASHIKHFFKYLYRNEVILFNPVEDLPFKKGIMNKKEIFRKKEINNFLDIETDEVYKALFELIYSSGLRISEVINLNLSDVDLKDRMLTIREGKGSKDRYIPFNEIAEKYLEKYIQGERKRLLKKVKGEDKKALFLTSRGRIKGAGIRTRFKKLLNDVKLTGRKLTVHSMRHSTGTHLLESGADVRYVQELLGHESIETTVAYTHLMMENLKRAYKSAHPRENKYYEEVTEEYLEDLKKLEDEIKKREEINKRYPPEKYNNNRRKN